MRLDPTTRAEYDALGPVADRAAHVVAALGSTVTATVYDGADSVRASGSMQAPWASTNGGRIVVGELASFLVTNGGAPDAGWLFRFEGNGRWVDGSFGLSDSGAEFRWSLGTFTTGQLGTIGTAEIMARGLEPVASDFAVSWSVHRSVEASFAISWDLLADLPFEFVGVPAIVELYRGGSAFDFASHISGGVAPYTFDHAGYVLPSGVSLTSDGLLSAAVTAGLGDSPPIAVRATDSSIT